MVAKYLKVSNYKNSTSFYLIVWVGHKKHLLKCQKKSFSLYVFEKYEIWMVEFARIIGFQLFCRFLKSTTTKLNTICFWQRKAKAPSGEFHFASYFSFRPFIYTQHYMYIHMWALWKHIHIKKFNAFFFVWLSLIFEWTSKLRFTTYYLSY